MRLFCAKCNTELRFMERRELLQDEDKVVDPCLTCEAEAEKKHVDLEEDAYKQGKRDGEARALEEAQEKIGALESKISELSKQLENAYQEGYDDGAEDAYMEQ